jgi:hypothetical protein
MNYLIAAGGTGQEIAAAVMRLCYLTGKEMPKIAVFDTDVGAADSGSHSVTRFQGLNDLQQRLLNLKALDEAVLTPYSPAASPGDQRTSARVVDSFSEFGRMTDGDKALLDILLDEKQKETSINDGFHGEPALGSLVFSSAVESGSCAKLLGEIEDAARSVKGVQVVLVSSLTGGVGTAVIPVLARKLHELRTKNATGIKLRVVALFQMSWFELEHSENEAGSGEPDVTSAMLDRNACCLMRGYLDQIDRVDGDQSSGQIDKAFFVGLPKHVKRISQGRSHQHETNHYINLISGVMAANLLTRSGEDYLVGSNVAERFFAPAVDTAGGSKVLRGDSAATRLHVAGDNSLTIEQIAKIARVMAATSRALAFEASNTNPSHTHHQAANASLSGLSANAKSSFAGALSSWARMHEELLAWLRRTIESKAGPDRADTLGIFSPDEGDDFYGAHASDALRALGMHPLRAMGSIDRRVLSELAIGATTSENDGARAAWHLIQSARKRAVERVR